MGFFSKKPSAPDDETEQLFALLLSPDDEERLIAVRLLPEAAPNHALEALIEAFDDEASDRVRTSIVYAIGRLPDSKAARAWLHRAHDDENPNVFCLAAIVLGQLLQGCVRAAPG